MNTDFATANYFPTQTVNHSNHIADNSHVMGDQAAVVQSTINTPPQANISNTSPTQQNMIAAPQNITQNVSFMDIDSLGHGLKQKLYSQFDPMALKDHLVNQALGANKDYVSDARFAHYLLKNEQVQNLLRDQAHSHEQLQSVNARIQNTLQNLAVKEATSVGSNVFISLNSNSEEPTTSQDVSMTSLFEMSLDNANRHALSGQRTLQPIDLFHGMLEAIDTYYYDLDILEKNQISLKNIFPETHKQVEAQRNTARESEMTNLRTHITQGVSQGVSQGLLQGSHTQRLMQHAQNTTSTEMTRYN